LFHFFWTNSARNELKFILNEVWKKMKIIKITVNFNLFIILSLVHALLSSLLVLTTSISTISIFYLPQTITQRIFLSLSFLTWILSIPTCKWKKKFLVFANDSFPHRPMSLLLCCRLEWFARYYWDVNTKSFHSFLLVLFDVVTASLAVSNYQFIRKIIFSHTCVDDCSFAWLTN
jgi:hypothetical protein